MLPWSTQYGISLYDWWLLIYRLPVAHCPVFIGGRNRLWSIFFYRLPSLGLSIHYHPGVGTAPMFPLSPSPLPPCPHARFQSFHFFFLFSVSNNIESLRLAPCDFTSTSTPSTDKFPFPLPPFPHKPEPVSLSRILSNSLSHHPDAPPHCHDFTTGRTVHCSRVITTLWRPSRRHKLLDSNSDRRHRRGHAVAPCVSRSQNAADDDQKGAHSHNSPTPL